MYETMLENELVPLMEINLAVHPGQEIIWLKPSHAIEFYVRNSEPLYHDRIKKYADILPRILKYIKHCDNFAVLGCIRLYELYVTFNNAMISFCFMKRYEYCDLGHHQRPR
jgi:hypothetical protein